MTSPFGVDSRILDKLDELTRITAEQGSAWREVIPRIDDGIRLLNEKMDRQGEVVSEATATAVAALAKATTIDAKVNVLADDFSTWVDDFKDHKRDVQQWIDDFKEHRKHPGAASSSTQKATTATVGGMAGAAVLAVAQFILAAVGFPITPK